MRDELFRTRHDVVSQLSSAFHRGQVGVPFLSRDSWADPVPGEGVQRCSRRSYDGSPGGRSDVRGEILPPRLF